MIIIDGLGVHGVDVEYVKHIESIMASLRKEEYEKMKEVRKSYNSFLKHKASLGIKV
ncbi:hypothetical protein Q7M76_04285 [Candidatus Liberibacter asiaticus]|uniref:hypothetical protein n=1 Tax=Liberibacter asiaticus TaxID=34021 RepID=UPI0003052B94|nr:hypothetical protein [Candidatus Liberibacter asiaticus]KAE9509839.1 hypothetical protein FXW22_04270 [Candidatus Liberibacter asiaticus]KAE9511351.1 hypothetical protein FXW31_01885 [Candidatus Liberibacter asiaticus]KAE9511974.1 hypothetical protein FXW32_04210 [Candidatus Liberibacter asiaticus]KAE9513052.1 hypothetical protein FXW35_04385 [Candidatus Liberibacter asiaticus]KAE9514139.1 hypothetical protein FXW25_04190 [Candidatus Liberibacter asiaticus]